MYVVSLFLQNEETVLGLGLEANSLFAGAKQVSKQEAFHEAQRKTTTTCSNDPMRTLPREHIGVQGQSIKLSRSKI